MSLRTMSQAATTMYQLQNRMDIIGHNLANSQTVGYKSRQAEFSSLLSQQITNVTDPENMRGRLTPDGIRVGAGARLGAINSNLSLGSIQRTDRDLDTMLLNENHFYEVDVDNEIHYTRNGSFYLNPINDGTEVVLVTADGHPVNGQTGPIQFAANFDAIYIADNGDIIVKRGTENELVGSLSIVEIMRSRSLETAGDNLFRVPRGETMQINEVVQPAAGDRAIVKNQAIEMSNVNIQEQMTDLINAQRSYQFNSRTISMADQMQGLVNQLR